MAQHRQVLLLGNGINLSFNGTAWKELLNKISVRDDFCLDEMTSPMPLQAVLLTNNNIKDAMKNNCEFFFGKVEDSQHRAILENLLALNFDDILTTNYSYELEEAALGIETISKTQLQRINERTSKKAELRYLLHTYNRVSYKGEDNRIWHIHGESRKPDSMVLGHYWYGNLLGRIKEDLARGKNQYHRLQNQGRPIEYDSWLDSFLLGDVYVVGFSFDLSELDLWWLLNRKDREKAEKGRLFFYEMENPDAHEKTELMRLFGAEVISFDMKVPDRGDPQLGQQYADFYRKVITDIKTRKHKCEE